MGWRWLDMTRDLNVVCSRTGAALTTYKTFCWWLPGQKQLAQTYTAGLLFPGPLAWLYGIFLAWQDGLYSQCTVFIFIYVPLMVLLLLVSACTKIFVCLYCKSAVSRCHSAAPLQACDAKVPLAPAIQTVITAMKWNIYNSFTGFF